MIPNIGSTSFKSRLLDMPGETVLAEGRVERNGSATNVRESDRVGGLGSSLWKCETECKSFDSAVKRFAQDDSIC